MAEPSGDPTNTELLKKICALQEENLKLGARVEDLEKRADNTHDAFMRLAQQVGGLLNDGILTDMQLMELMAKVFPDWARTQTQVLEVFKSKDKTN